MAYKYITADNWGKDFFTHEERTRFHLSGYPGNVWVVGDNHYGDAWIGKVSGVSKTKAEAQAIVDTEVEAAKLLGIQSQMIIKLHTQDQQILHYHSKSI